MIAEPAFTQSRKAPLPPGPGVFTTLRGLNDEVLNFFYRCFKTYGDVVRLPFLGQHIILVSHPDDVAHVMKKNVDNYSKGGFGYKELKLVLGNGLGPTMGEMWRRQRKVATPAFAPAHLNTYATRIGDVAGEWAARWRSNLQSEPVLDFGEQMLEMNLHVSCKTLIAAEISAETLHQASENFVFLVQDMEHRVGRAVNIPLSIPTPHNRRVKQVLREIDGFVENIVEQRRRDPNPPEDLLTILMKGSGHPDDEKIPNLLQDHVKNFFFGGHETSGYTLTWMFYLLAKNPEVDRKMHAEIAAVLGGRRPTAEDAKQLVYTNCVIQETLRLYPIFPMLPRRCVAEDHLRGYRIPAGANIMICPYLTNRHPDFWKDPETFRPERFLEDERTHPMAMIPFGGGQSICIGRNFGLLSTLMIATTLRQQFRFELADNSDIPILMPGFSLQPARPVRMRPVPAATPALDKGERSAMQGCPFHAQHGNA